MRYPLCPYFPSPGCERDTRGNVLPLQKHRYLALETSLPGANETLTRTFVFRQSPA